jgi:hypothetical protein
MDPIGSRSDTTGDEEIHESEEQLTLRRDIEL